jgi:hypothetical protein
MLNERLTAARRIAEALGPAEADIETAIASTSRLITAIASGRERVRVPVTTGQSSLAALSGVVRELIEARAGIAEAHAALARDRVDVGLGPYAMGDVGDCPSTSAALETAETGLRSVA